MKNYCIVYFDLPDVTSEIKSVINIHNYGELFYKKQKLVNYHQAIFQANNLNIFYHLQSEEDVEQFINYHSHSNTEAFIFLTSGFTVVNPELFSNFLQRIQYIDSSLAIFLHDDIKPFLKLTKKEIIGFLKVLLLNSDSQQRQQLLSQHFGHVEKFRLEKFYLEVNTYIGFISFLQNNFELRYFNSIELDGLSITKKSVQKDKMLREFSYYNFLPENLKLYFLRPYNYKETANEAEYSLERLNIPDLAIQWIHFSIDQTQFKILIQKLFIFLKSRTEKKGVKVKALEVADNLYITKIKKRNELFKETSTYEQINSIIKNGTSYDGISAINQHFETLYTKVVTSRKPEESIVLSHGDLCFSNILYDKRIDYIKFIDPKGCTNEEDAYLDRYYDVAKLSHSILGHYDFINNGLFELNFDNSLQLSLVFDRYQHNAFHKEEFKKLLAENQFDYKLVRLYEASLFLSMLPLHIDFPKKVVAFILTAIGILNEIEHSNA